MIKDRAKTLRAFIENLAKDIDDNTALEYPEAFPKWKVDIEYHTDDRIRYNDILYKVLQNHTSQSTWTPDTATSLYVRVDSEEYPEWRQPVGAADAYRLGDKVSHNEKHWISVVDYNTWEPGIYGWEGEQ